MSDLAREEAVAAAIEAVRRIEHSQGITRPALDAIKAEMMKLAAREELFPSSHFPPPPAGEKSARRYVLHQDPDGRFALYLIALNPGNETRPHDHTTWAVVTAVEGQELNRVYRRTDDRSQAGRAHIELDREVMVEPGTGIALMPEDIHSIHTNGSVPTRHLHMYGLALEKLDQRQAYDPATDTMQNYNAAFMQPNARAAAG